MNKVLKHADISDASTLLSLQIDTFHKAGYYGGGPAGETIDELIHSMKEDEVYLLYLDDVLSGSIRVHQVGEHEFRFKRLFIAQDAQNKGVGKWLMRSVEARYDWHKITLDTPIGDKRNRAFYKSLGYEEVGTTNYNGFIVVDLEKRRNSQ